MDSTIGALHDPDDRPFDESAGIGVLIQVSRGQQRHVGILFKDLDDTGASAQVLELQWHHRVAVGPASALVGYLWAEPTMEPERAYLLAKLCKLIADRYAGKTPSIKYALRYAGQRFNDDGVFMNEGGLGLTCATFVMALFVSRGAGLLQWTEWPEREEDRAWQKQVVEMLRHKEHIEAVKNEAARGCARYRPEEVAAAAVACELPVGFAYAEHIGRRIVARLAAPRRG